MNERLVPLAGTLNFRDLGGYSAADGRTVRWGRVYRSDGLDQLTDADQAHLARLGIKVICDFRNDREVGEAPSRLPEALAARRFPIGEGDNVSMIDMILAGELVNGGVDFMAGAYLSILDVGASAFAATIALAADEANLPLLFHCTAGKDRTGIMSALLLGVLGVSDEDILDDYELTTHYRSGKRLEALRPSLEKAGVDIDAVRAVFTAERPVLAATLDAIRDRWGGPAGYLTGPGGLDASVVDALRANLLHASGSP